MPEALIPLQVRVNQSMYESIDEFAHRAGLSKNKFIVAAIAAALMSEVRPRSEPVPDVPQPVKPPPAVIRTPEEAKTAVKERGIEVQPYTKEMQTGRKRRG